MRSPTIAASLSFAVLLVACGNEASTNSSIDGGSAGTDSAAASSGESGGADSPGTGDSGGLADADGDAGSDGPAASDGPVVGDSGAGDSGETGPVSPACAGKSCGDPCGNGEFPMVCDSQGKCVIGAKCP